MLAVQAALFNLFEQIVLTLYLLFGVRELRLGAGELGLILTTASVGGLVGVLLSGQAAAAIGTGRCIVISMVVSAAGLVVVPFAPATPVLAIVVLVGGFVVYGFGLGIFSVHSLSVRMAQAPPELLGRITATFRLLIYGTIPIGALLAEGAREPVRRPRGDHAGRGAAARAVDAVLVQLGTPCRPLDRRKPMTTWDRRVGRDFYSSANWLDFCATEHGAKADTVIAGEVAVPVFTEADLTGSSYDWNAKLAERSLPALPAQGPPRRAVRGLPDPRPRAGAGRRPAHRDSARGTRRAWRCTWTPRASAGSAPRACRRRRSCWTATPGCRSPRAATTAGSPP